jgi:hypothetical protein
MVTSEMKQQRPVCTEIQQVHPVKLNKGDMS